MAEPAIEFRPPTRADYPRLAGWFPAPHAQPWFANEPADIEGLEALYGPIVDGTELTFSHIVEIGGVAWRYLRTFLSGHRQTAADTRLRHEAR